MPMVISNLKQRIAKSMIIDDRQGWTSRTAEPSDLVAKNLATETSGSQVKPEEDQPIKHFALRDIVLRIPRGAFVCVVGCIGSGKSALLQGLLGEMKRTRGSVRSGAGVSLVTQIPWIQSGTVKDNITFGQGHDKERLEQVVRACALEPDLRILSDGLMTEIGGELS